MSPYADVAIARRILEELNRKSAFRGMLQLSQMDIAPIKIASIVKFALRYLVDVDSEGGLFEMWSKDNASKKKLRDKNSAELLAEYVKYCATTLDLYFSALKSLHKQEWGSSASKITSTTVINAMIIALRRSLPARGILDFNEYVKMMKAWEVDFSKEAFPFASSQYARFSHSVLRDMFDLTESNGQWVIAK